MFTPPSVVGTGQDHRQGQHPDQEHVAADDREQRPHVQADHGEHARQQERRREQAEQAKPPRETPRAEEGHGGQADPDGARERHAEQLPDPARVLVEGRVGDLDGLACRRGRSRVTVDLGQERHEKEPAHDPE